MADPPPNATDSTSDEIPIARPWLGESETRALAEAVASGWVGQGPRVAAFEQRLAAQMNAPHAVATSSGTTALHLALVAAGVGPGDEVIVPGLSFIATANAVRMTGATPVFADVSRETLNLDPADAARRVTPRSRALLVVHQLGLPADLAAFKRLAIKHRLLLIEDAACALGSRYQGEPIGKPHGQLCCFSFHPRKVITTGEGGALTTADPAMAETLRRLRNHGASTAPPEAPAATGPTELGYNYRMSDLHAAVGVAQLGRLEAILARRRALASLYDEQLAGHPSLYRPQAPAEAESNHQSYHLTLTAACTLTPTQIIAALAQQRISARPGLTAMHREPLYATPDSPSLPNTEQLAARGLMLPLYPELTEAQALRVCNALKTILNTRENHH